MIKVKQKELEIALLFDEFYEVRRSMALQRDSLENYLTMKTVSLRFFIKCPNWSDDVHGSGKLP